MSQYLYERDLRSMKLLILESRRHDAVAREVATILGIKRQKVRKILIEKLDMAFLENIPARCDAVRSSGDEISTVLGIPLLTRALMLLPREEGDLLVDKTQRKIKNGVQRDVALKEAREEILELISR